MMNTSGVSGEEDEGIWGSADEMSAGFSQRQRGDNELENNVALGSHSKWKLGLHNMSTPKEACAVQSPIGRSPQDSEMLETCSKKDGSENDAHPVHLTSITNKESFEAGELLQECQRPTDQTSEPGSGTSLPENSLLCQQEKVESHVQFLKFDEELERISRVDRALPVKFRKELRVCINTDSEKDKVEETHQKCSKFIHDTDTGTLGSHQVVSKKSPLPVKDLSHEEGKMSLYNELDTINYPRKFRSRSPNSRGSMSPRLRSMSPVRQSGMPDHRNSSRSPARHGRSLARSNFPRGNPMRIRRGRGFTDRYAFVRKYRTPSPERYHPSSFQNRGRNTQNMNPGRYRNRNQSRSISRRATGYRGGREIYRGPMVWRRSIRLRQWLGPHTEEAAQWKAGIYPTH